MQAQAKYSEFMRQREEKLKQIDIGSNLFNRNVGFGNMSTTTKTPSILGQMFGTISPIVGSYNTAKYGANAAPGQAGFSDFASAFKDGNGGLGSLFKTLMLGGL